MRPLSSSLLIVTCAAAPLAAQIRVESGGGSSHLDQLPATSLTAIGGGVDAAAGRMRFHFSGTTDDHTGVGVAGAMNGALHVALTPGPWRIEVGPSAQAARDIGAAWATSWAGDVSAEREVGRFTVRGGWQVGRAQVGNQHSTWYRPELSSTIRLGNFAFGTSWRGAFAQDSVLKQGFFSDTIGSSRDSVYTGRMRDIHDVGVQMQWSSPLLSLSGHVTRRFGSSVAPQTWWEGSASLRVTPMVALTMKSGRLAADMLLGLRGGQYTTLGLRFDLLQRIPRHDNSDNTAPALVERESAGRVRLTFILAPGVRQATIASDLTDWHPQNLSRTEDGRWEIVLDAKSGVHRLNISSDNGPWLAPRGLPATDDGFGSKVALLVIE